ncbi:PAS domain S-box-containing protein [Noviherbaspirillum humi]|uniref:PAS domain S-box-containing protein n=1 Tax=Noviherbaspirillum humi TaxID=1688639 RepID=A0A239IGF0_9BURK|nr:PAS domain S-box protein [Noviherbaspirillum humi]SNS92645.1 PAS domain S-box-containing protein [Noviherbaspirillum humi]
MRNSAISPDKIKEILRLKTVMRLSHEQIAQTLGLSKGVVGKYVKLAKNAGLDWPAVQPMGNAELKQRLQGRRRQPLRYVTPDYGRIHFRLSRDGNTLRTEWERYQADHAEQKIYRYTQFCEHYHSFVLRLGRSLRQVFRCGEKIFSGFTETAVPVGDGSCAHIFLAVIGASRLAFACVAAADTADDWIRCAIRALHFYGGVPRFIVSDGSHGMTPIDAARDNELVLSFARHYGTSVMPSMPQDVGQRAPAVLLIRFVERWILRELRLRQFATAAQIEAALQPCLERLNHRPFRQLSGNRATAFAELDQPALSSLPAQPYEFPGPLPRPLPAKALHPAVKGKPKAKIVVAESDAGTRTYLEQLFGKEHEVISAPNGPLALQAAIEHRPELVLSGLPRPEPGGFDLLDALRAETSTSATAFVLLFSRPIDNADEEGLLAAVDDWLPKPFNGRELLSKARGMCALTRSRREAQRSDDRLSAGRLTILDGLSEGFMAVDFGWRITYLNAAAEMLSRLPRAYLVNRNFWEVFYTLKGTLAEFEYHRAMSSRMPVRFEYYDAHYQAWTEMSASPMEEGGLLLCANDITDRKRAQEVLQGAEARLSAELQAMSQLQLLGIRLLDVPDFAPALQEVLSAAISMLGAAMGTIQLYSPQTQTLEIVAQLGFSEEFLAHFQSLKRDENTASGRAATHGKRIIVQDAYLDPSFAASRPLLASAGVRAWQSTPLFSRDGKLLGVLSTHFREPHYPLDRKLRMLDLYARKAVSIIERLHGEVGLREQQEFFGMILNSTIDGLMTLDAESRFTYFNVAARNMLAEQGINADSLIGKQYLTEAFREARDDESGLAFLRATRERVPVEVENYYVPFDRWYLIRFFPMNGNGMVIAVQDITERRRAVEALRESETRFRALAEASPGLIWQVDPKGNAVYLNPRFRELLGVPLKDLMGTAWHKVIHLQDLPSYVAALDEAIRQHGRLRHRVRVKRTDGEWRWLETNALPWFTSEGEYAGHVGISIDISDALETAR